MADVVRASFIRTPFDTDNFTFDCKSENDDVGDSAMMLLLVYFIVYGSCKSPYIVKRFNDCYAVGLYVGSNFLLLSSKLCQGQ